MSHIDGDVSYYVKSKMDRGFRAYTFYELCRLKGYWNAVELVYQYRSAKTGLQNSFLVKDFEKLHCDGFQFKVQIDEVEIEFYTDYQGKIITGKFAGDHFREWHAEKRAEGFQVKASAKPIFLDEITNDEEE